MQDLQEWLKDFLPEGTPAGQAEAVTRDDELITVEAGAGTGKTWVLSARFARLLRTDLCLPQNILTLTYTEAAAREMQERIRRRALEVFGGQEDLTQTPGAQTLRDGFDEAWISTIHSFASRMIRESGLSLDIDPRSGVVNAPQEEAFWGALERALENTDLFSFALSHGGKDLLETASLLERDEVLFAALEKWKPSVLRDLARDVTELHASLGNSHETLLSWADEIERAGDFQTDPRAEAAHEAVLELLRPRWEDAWQIWNGIFEELGPGILAARENALRKTDAKRVNPAIPLAELMEKWHGFLPNGLAADGLSSQENFSPNFDHKRSFYLELCSRLSGDNSKLFKAITEHLGQTAGVWRKAQARWVSLSEFPPGAPLSEAERRLRATLLRLSAFAWGAWDEMKRRRGLLSFADMIRFAAQSIRQDARPKGFRHVLIDEFQDTDPLQDAMIQALREKEGAKLFLVGDPKQAIYRFRHADLTLFADYVLKSRASRSDIALDVSFRTRAVLLDTINSLFTYIWKDGLGAGKRMESLKFEPLSAWAADPPVPERELPSVPPFTPLLSVKKKEGSGEARERLDRALARLFVRWMKEGRTVWDKGSQTLRPARWRDFAVLTPTRGEYELLEAAFEAEGVPVSFEKSKSYFSRGEVVDLVNTLRAAAFPDDETALAGWLASPFSNVPQREVQACLETRFAAPLAQVLKERLPEASERLEYLRRLGSLRGPSAVLSHLMEDRKWLGVFRASQRPRVTANVNRAILIARQYESGVSPSLAGCAQWLDTALRSERALEEAEWMDEEADAVCVMTVHASKGLEFPIVAVMRTERGLRSRPPATVAASKEMGVALSSIPDMMVPDVTQSSEKEEENEKEEARSLQWERALSRQKELEESMRLFYVAATRAQDSLILCGVLDENSKGERKANEDSWLSRTLNWLGEEYGQEWQELESPLVFVPDFLPEEIESEIEVESGESPEGEKQERTSRRAPEERIPPPEPLDLPSVHEGVSLSTFSATSFALFEWCPFAWRRRHRQGVDLRWEIPDADFSDTDVGGSELGSIAHWILARWDLREETLHEWLDAKIAFRLPTTLRESWREEKNREALRSWLVNFSRSEEGRAMAGLEENAAPARALFRESAFCVTLDAGQSGGGTRLVGATDVLWQDSREKGFWHVRDYKITLSDNAPEELYRAQLAFYALAVKLLAERKPSSPLFSSSFLPSIFSGVDVGLIFLREGGKLGDARSFPREREANWRAIQDQVLAAARDAVQGPWLPRREHCSRCPWRVGCPGKGRMR